MTTLLSTVLKGMQLRTQDKVAREAVLVAAARHRDLCLAAGVTMNAQVVADEVRRSALSDLEPAQSRRRLRTRAVCGLNEPSGDPDWTSHIDRVLWVDARIKPRRPLTGWEMDVTGLRS